MAKRNEIKITEDQEEILDLYEKGRTVKHVSDLLQIDLQILQSELSFFRKLGVLRGDNRYKDGPIVNWDLLEKIKKGDIDITKILHQYHKESQSEFSREEIATLKKWAEYELTKDQSQRSGMSRATSLRIDTGLLERLRKRAREDKITIGECLNRSIEVYINIR